MDEVFLNILRCPVTHSRLAVAPQDLVSRVNRAVAAGRICNRVGQTLTQPLDGGLMNADRSLLLPIYEDIPNLTVEDAIALDQLDAAEEDGEGEGNQPEKP